MTVATVKADLREHVDAVCPSIRKVLSAAPLKPPAGRDLPAAFIDRVTVKVGGSAYDTFEEADATYEARLIVLVEPTTLGTLAEDTLDAVQEEVAAAFRPLPYLATVTAVERYGVSEVEYRAVVAVIRIEGGSAE